MSGGSSENGVTLFAKSLSIDGGWYKAADSNLGVNLITAAVTNDGAATVTLILNNKQINTEHICESISG
jgi:hypothetical protein